MNILDIISDSPRTFIFEKKANKTNLGGVLTFLYFIILILIVAAYLYDYYNNDQFQFTYFYKNIKDEDKVKYKEKNNPEITFTFEIMDKTGQKINKKIFIYNKKEPIFVDPCFLSKEFNFDLTQKYRKNYVYQKINYGSEVCNYNSFFSNLNTLKFDCRQFDKVETIENLFYGILSFNIQKDSVDDANKVYNLPFKCTKKIDHLSVDINYNINMEDYIDLFNNIYEYYLKISYEGQILDHENVESPVIKSKIEFEQRFFTNNLTMIETYWGIYDYKEEKGMWSKIYDKIFDKDIDYDFGFIESYQVYSIPSITKIPQIPIFPNISKESDIIFKKQLVDFQMFNKLNGIHQYKRKKKSIWDSLANIAALGTTIFNIICKAFGFIYSGNFDNYKIVENLLSKEFNKIRRIKLNFNENNNSFIDINSKNKLIDKTSEDITLSKEGPIINDVDNIDEDDNENNELLPDKLPKLRFFDFFFNNVYSKCCIYIKRQKLIDTCDDILYKYYSIENILYSQIIFENLIKDYKWNNSELKSIYSNDLIMKIKNYL